jgi:GPH family glycoside/pentoside/hexuronide:cation symporter
MVLLQKLGLALGLFLVGIALESSGFNEALSAAEQPDAARFAIRLMVGPIPTVMLICGLVLNWFYPITKEKHAEIMAAIEAKKRSTGHV